MGGDRHLEVSHLQGPKLHRSHVVLGCFLGYLQASCFVVGLQSVEGPRSEEVVAREGDGWLRSGDDDEIWMELEDRILRQRPAKWLDTGLDI